MMLHACIPWFDACEAIMTNSQRKHQRATECLIFSADVVKSLWYTVLDAPIDEQIPRMNDSAPTAFEATDTEEMSWIVTCSWKGAGCCV